MSQSLGTSQYAILNYSLHGKKKKKKKKKEHAKTAASIPGKKDQNKQKIEKNVFN